MARFNLDLLGKKVNGVLLIERKLISIRKVDGTFLGPRVTNSEEDTIILHPSDSPLNYTQGIIDEIIKDGWNDRDFYDLDNLISEIRAAEKIRDPLQLLAEGDYLFASDGHSRLVALDFLEKEGLDIKFVPAIISTLSIREAEYNRIAKEAQRKHSVLAMSKLLIRQLKEDEKGGLTPKESRQKFIQNTGWSGQKYDDHLNFSKTRPEIKKLFKDGIFSQTTILKLLRKEFTSDEQLNILLEANKTLKETRKTKVPEKTVLGIAQDLEEQKRAELIQATEQQEQKEEQEQKQIVSEKQEVSEKKEIEFLEETTETTETPKQNQLKAEAKVLLPKATDKELAKIVRVLFQSLEEVYLETEINKEKIILKCDSEIYNNAKKVINRGLKTFKHN